MAPQGKTFKFDIKGGKEKTAESLDYSGPTPPPGAYRMKLKRLTMADGPAILGLFEINETGENAKYNGFGIFGRQNITDQGAPYVNQMLLAISNNDESVKDAFWDQGAKAKQDEKQNWQVKKIGSLNVNSPDCDIDVVVVLKMGKPYKGKSGMMPAKLEVSSYVAISRSGLAAAESDEDEYPSEAVVDEDEYPDETETESDPAEAETDDDEYDEDGEDGPF